MRLAIVHCHFDVLYAVRAVRCELVTVFVGTTAEPTLNLVDVVVHGQVEAFECTEVHVLDALCLELITFTRDTSRYLREIAVVTVGSEFEEQTRVSFVVGTAGLGQPF